MGGELTCNADSNAERLNAAADAIRAELGSANRPDSIHTIVCDIRSEEQVRWSGDWLSSECMEGIDGICGRDWQVDNLVDETLAKFKRIDFLINNGARADCWLKSRW